MVIPRGENVLLWDVTTHREPAVVGAAADDPDVMPELICDGIHIHPCMVRNTFRLFGAHRMILISDSMRAVGMEDGQYTLGGQEVTVRGALATLADGTIAGSATPSGHSEGRDSIIVCCELFVAGRCPETVENMAFGYLSFQRIVQTFFIFELLIYPRVISIIKGIVIAHNLTYVILNNDKAIEI